MITVHNIKTSSRYEHIMYANITQCVYIVRSVCNLDWRNRITEQKEKIIIMELI